MASRAQLLKGSGQGQTIEEIRWDKENTVEVVSLLQRVSNTRERTITLDVEMEDYHRIKNEGRQFYGTPIQIRIMDDSMTISNRCILPENWTVDTLMEIHDSIPYNPDIANVFFRAGLRQMGQGFGSALNRDWRI